MTPLLYTRLCKEDGNYSRNFQLLLAGTIRPTAPVSNIRGVEPPLQAIRSYLKPSWGDSTYRVTMRFCRACCQEREHPFVEALDGCGGLPGNGSESTGKAALYSQTIVSSFGVLTSAIRNACEEKNEDGSYLSELQLRERFHSYMADQCEVVNTYGDTACKKKGMCGVLPGDTVVWTEDYEYGLTMTRFEPATKEELIERGWLVEGQPGKYESWAKCFREEKETEKTTGGKPGSKKRPR